jgi:hypothetical protein
MIAIVSNAGVFITPHEHIGIKKLMQFLQDFSWTIATFAVLLGLLHCAIHTWCIIHPIIRLRDGVSPGGGAL